MTYLHRWTRTAGAFLLCIILTIGLLPAVATPAYADSPVQGAANDVATDGILVVLKNESSTASGSGIRVLATDTKSSVEDQLSRAGMDITDTLNTLDGSPALTAQPADGQSIEDAVNAAEALPGVAYAQPNYVYHLIEPAELSEVSAEDIALMSSQISNLEKNIQALNGHNFTDSNQTGLDQAGLDQLNSNSTDLNLMVNDPYAVNRSGNDIRNQYWLYNTHLTDAWNIAKTNHAITIAFLDSGLAAYHEDLYNNVMIDQAWDAYNNRPLNFNANLHGDNGGHGTIVAGIAAAVTDNGIGIAGGSYNANIIPIKVTNDTPDQTSNTSTLLSGFNRVLSLREAGMTNLHVVNMSLGSYDEAVNDQALKDAIATAKNQYQIISICAGGNGVNGRATTEPCYPADFDDCVSVTALAPDNTNALFSDYNQFKDISAPGETIFSTGVNPITGNPIYTTASGTSMAAPMVSATCALMFAAVPDATAQEVRDALLNTATPINTSVNDWPTGSKGALHASNAITYLQTHHRSTFGFSDIQTDAWYYDPIKFALEHHLMSGYAGTDRFDPDGVLTRAQFAQVLYNYRGANAAAPAAPLADVDQSQWYASAVNWAVSEGYITGYTDGSNRFGVDDPLTRQQAAVILARIAGANLITAHPAKFDGFPDAAAVESYAHDAMVWATDTELITGAQRDGATLLVPGDSITRAQIAAILMRAIDKRLV